MTKNNIINYYIGHYNTVIVKVCWAEQSIIRHPRAVPGSPPRGLDRPPGETLSVQGGTVLQSAFQPVSINNRGLQY